MKYILHIVGDHSASDYFVNQIVQIYPKNNIVVRINDTDKAIALSKDGNHQRFENVRSFIRHVDFSLISVIIVHYLDFNKELFILKCFNESIPVLWWMYGQDLYSRLFLKGYKLYAPQTLPYVQNRANNPITFLRHLRFEWRKQLLDKRALKRIVGVIPCEMPDYQLACELLERKVDIVDIYTRSIVSNDSFSNGNDICVGHSASMTGNHLYALEYLKGVDVQDSKIWMPLSYTVQSEVYRKAVVDKYREEFGEKVHFIFDYQDISTFRSYFYNYKVAIYSTWRQEALYNIFMCFQTGVKVFLSRNNPCFDFFRDQGYIVYALEDLSGSNDLLPLNREEQEHNRRLFRQIKSEREYVSPINIKNYFAKYL